jgi:hypothetical protein
VYFHCWLHCPPLTLANRYSGYISCCPFGI